jgi:uncharacterized protein YraI
MLSRWRLPLALAAGLVACAAPAAAQCTGTVYGLSPYYNPASGSGFLAVRSGPSTRAQQVGELFNGDRVNIGESSGPWVRVMGQVNGWAHQRWLSVRCDGNLPMRPPPSGRPPPQPAPPAPPPPSAPGDVPEAE